MSTAKTIFNKAKETIKDRKNLTELVEKTSKKLSDFAAKSPEWKEFKEKVNLLIKMLKCHLSGEYRAFSTSSILLVAFALIYFITPTDAIPDFIPILGFTDDATILLLIYRKLNKDIEAFLNWSGGDH